MRAWNNDDVVGLGLVVLGETVTFTEETFDAIACDGVSKLAGNGQAEAVVGEIVGSGHEGKGAGVFAHLCVVDMRELGAAGEAVSAWEGEFVGRVGHVEIG